MLDDDDYDDEEGNAFEKLFICEDYRELIMDIKGISITTQEEVMKEITLLSSSVSCTDYDLTGQIVWPVNSKVILIYYY